MSVFDHQRLNPEIFKLDLERLQKGWYSDKYFVNITNMLVGLRNTKFSYTLKSDHIPKNDMITKINPGDLEVEMQWFTRHPGDTVVVGIDKAVAILKTCTGYWQGDTFINTWDKLDVWAVEDGEKVSYSGDPMKVKPVIKARGRYSDFANLETPTLGVLTRSSRVATNVYETMVAARGKPVLFFPARFDLHEVQAADGYAYQIAVNRFNEDFGKGIGSFVSTDAQGDWWGGAGGGTLAHSAISCFMGDTAEAMLAFASLIDPHVTRIALIDFNNNSVGDSLATCKAMFFRFKNEIDSGNIEEAKKYVLNGVRLDTSANLCDISIELIGDPILDHGVNSRLVQNVRNALDHAWESWEIPEIWKQRAREYCQNVKIVVSGGFNVDKINQFEQQSVPVDMYAVGSAFFENHGINKMDFTADVVRVNLNGKWIDMAKVGRTACVNPNLKKVE